MAEKDVKYTGEGRNGVAEGLVIWGLIIVVIAFSLGWVAIEMFPNTILMVIVVLIGGLGFTMFALGMVVSMLGGD